MNREPHSPNNASMNINWFKETRAIPQTGMEYFAYRNLPICVNNNGTKIDTNPNNLLVNFTLEQIKEFADNYVRDKIL